LRGGIPKTKKKTEKGKDIKFFLSSGEEEIHLMEKVGDQNQLKKDNLE